MPPIAVKTNVGRPFIELTRVDSTNIYAMESVQANKAVHGAAFFAHEQFAGKGRPGKNWNTEPGSNIILSVVLDTSFLSLSEQFPVSVMIAVSCHKFFIKYAPEEVTIKWPNDIYWRDRKAGGILIKNSIRGNIWQYSIAGMGININQAAFPTQLKNAVSLKQLTGKHFDVVVLAQELCSIIDKQYTLLREGEFDQMLAYYNQHLFRRGMETKLKKDTAIFKCTINGVNAAGELLVSGTAATSFGFNEVQWVI